MNQIKVRLSEAENSAKLFHSKEASLAWEKVFKEVYDKFLDDQGPLTMPDDPLYKDAERDKTFLKTFVFVSEYQKKCFMEAMDLNPEICSQKFVIGFFGELQVFYVHIHFAVW